MSRIRPRETYGPPKTGKRTHAEGVAIARWRLEFVAEVCKCELCNRTYSLAVHEISRGTSRKASLTNRSCILVLCNSPHGIRQSCHGVVQVWEPSRQLALLYLRRPGDYDLAEFWRVTKRRTPEQADVNGWIRRLLGQNT